MISALFWDITQRIMIDPYRRFSTTYRSIFKGHVSFRVRLLTAEVWTERVFRNVCKELTRNMSKERTSRLPRDGTLKSCVVVTV